MRATWGQRPPCLHLHIPSQKLEESEMLNSKPACQVVLKVFVKVGGRNVLYLATRSLIYNWNIQTHGPWAPLLLLFRADNITLATGFLQLPSSPRFRPSNRSQGLGNSILLVPGSDAVCQSYLSSLAPGATGWGGVWERCPLVGMGMQV